jgi:hypothetical protein
MFLGVPISITSRIFVLLQTGAPSCGWRIGELKRVPECAYNKQNFRTLAGGGTLLWLALWWWLAYDTPETCPRISQAEKDYILANIGSAHDKVQH